MELHSIAETLVAQLWEKNYFNTIDLVTDHGKMVRIISTGQPNRDSGPDFKDITLMIDNQIQHGDLEIHRSADDWYLHGHHTDSAYNDVILHLIVGTSIADKQAIRINQQPVTAQVFVNISREEIQSLIRTYKLTIPFEHPQRNCKLSSLDNHRKLCLIEKAGLVRFQQKADRFLEERAQNSWNQIIYKGIMEALGYSKNQRPFRTLAQLLPYEMIHRELQSSLELTDIQALFFGVAGLLPSQDPKLMIRDAKDAEVIAQLEASWAKIQQRIGVVPMKRESWQFFRLRPDNFPTRRLAGASFLFNRFLDTGLLETLLNLFQSFNDESLHVIREMEILFICEADGFWSRHYLLNEKGATKDAAALIGRNRAREIIVNIILPAIYAYAKETENGHLQSVILQVARQYPKTSANEIIRYMVKHLRMEESPKIYTAMKQQGLIHFYKMYCKNEECNRCIQSIEDFNLA